MKQISINLDLDSTSRFDCCVRAIYVFKLASAKDLSCWNKINNQPALAKFVA